MKINPVLRVTSKIMIPLILLFALYVQFHGDFGPGGGFQAGVIFGSAFVLYTMVFGLEAGRAVIPLSVLKFFMSLGVFLYGGVGVATLLLGGGFLDYDYLGETAVGGQHLGIFLVELGVGITVASVMMVLFQVFAGRGRAR